MILGDLDVNVALLGQYSFEVVSDGDMETQEKEKEDEEQEDEQDKTMSINRSASTREYIRWLKEQLEVNNNRKVKAKLKNLLEEVEDEQAVEDMKEEIEGMRKETFGDMPDE